MTDKHPKRPRDNRRYHLGLVVNSAHLSRFAERQVHATNGIIHTTLRASDGELSPPLREWRFNVLSRVTTHCQTWCGRRQTRGKQW